MNRALRRHPGHLGYGFDENDRAPTDEPRHYDDTYPIPVVDRREGETDVSVDISRCGEGTSFTLPGQRRESTALAPPGIRL